MTGVLYLLLWQVPQPVPLPKSPITMTIAPQGAEMLRALTGKRIPGVGVVAVTVCSTDTAHIGGGIVYQAMNAAGISTISRRAAIPITLNTVKKSKWKIALDVGTAAVAGAALLGAGGIVHMPAQAITGLVAGSGAGKIAAPLVQARIPDPTPLNDAILDPTASIQLSPGTCQESFVMVIFDKKLKAGPLSQLSEAKQPDWWPAMKQAAMSWLPVANKWEVARL